MDESWEQLLGASPAERQVKLGVRLGKNEAGQVQLLQVLTRSPAQRAGLRTGDVVLEFQGLKIETPQQLLQQIRGSKAGKTTLLIRRGTIEMEVQPVLVQ
jgi:putative serine protease PepD